MGENEMLSFVKYLHSIYPLFMNAHASGHYHKYFAIIQSSGWGKSRLVFEACRRYEISLVYACFRSGSGADKGYPPRVQPAHDFFESSTIHAASALQKCMDIIRSLIWIVTEDRQSENPKYTTGQSHQMGIFESLWIEARQKAEAAGFSERFSEWFESIKTSESSSMSSSSSSSSASHIPFKSFLVFDEASYLVDKPLTVDRNQWTDASDASTDSSSSRVPHQINMFRLLRRALLLLSEELMALKTIAIFIDTSSSVSNFAPSQQAEKSTRDMPAKMLPVYFALNTDPSIFVQRDPFLFGRPMWGAVAALGQNPQAIVQLAQMKILGGTEPIRFSGLDEHARQACSAAIMSCLLDLDVQAGSKLHETLIRSNMVSLLKFLFLFDVLFLYTI